MDTLNDIILDIGERQSVLYEIERVLFTHRYNISRKHLDIFSIQSIAMIYSIWEGFVQNAFSLFVKEINSNNIKFVDLSEEIELFCIESTFKQLKEYPKEANKKKNFLSHLHRFFSKEIQPIHHNINTNNNVGFSVLNRLLLTFNLEPLPKHWGNYQYPNSNLEEILSTFLKYRNGVAHGGDLRSEEKVTQEVFEKYKNLIIDLMFDIYNKMIDGLERKTYLKEVPS